MLNVNTYLNGEVVTVLTKKEMKAVEKEIKRQEKETKKAEKRLEKEIAKNIKAMEKEQRKAEKAAAKEAKRQAKAEKQAEKLIEKDEKALAKIQEKIGDIYVEVSKCNNEEEIEKVMKKAMIKLTWYKVKYTTLKVVRSLFVYKENKELVYAKTVSALNALDLMMEQNQPMHA